MKKNPTYAVLAGPSDARLITCKEIRLGDVIESVAGRVRTSTTARGGKTIEVNTEQGLYKILSYRRGSLVPKERLRVLDHMNKELGTNSLFPEVREFAGVVQYHWELTRDGATTIGYSKHSHEEDHFCLLGRFVSRGVEGSEYNPELLQAYLDYKARLDRIKLLDQSYEQACKALRV